MTEKTDRQKLLENALASIDRQYGKGTVYKYGDGIEIKNIVVIPTGSFSLDRATGVGGYPRGRIIEIIGPESSGKTTMALHAIAEAQKLGYQTAFIDAEHALDTVYAKNLGVNMDELLISQPDYGEQALEVVEKLTAAQVELIVVDSVAALTPKLEIEGEMGDSVMGLHARLMSQAMRKLAGVVSKKGSTIIFINQIRDKIGVMFGPKETTTGGRALKFYSSIRLDVRRIGAVKYGEEIVGNKTKVNVIKNKVAPPFKQVEIDIIYGKGIDYVADVAKCAVDAEIIEKSGSWYGYQGVRLGQGKEAVSVYLRDNHEVLEGLIEQLKDKPIKKRDISEDDELIEVEE